MRTTSDYQALITPWLAAKPTFVATIGMTVAAFASVQVFLNTVPSAYDLDDAIGAQLDVVGLWVGLSRHVTIPLPDAYFSWGVPGLGWGQGYWQGPYDPTTGVASLDDATYRTMLRLKIESNNWDGTTTTANTDLAVVFDMAGTYVWIDDHYNMSASIVVSGEVPTAIILSLLVGGYLTFQAATVLYDVKITSQNGAPVFGWGQNDSYIGGWGSGAWGTDDLTKILY